MLGTALLCHFCFADLKAVSVLLSMTMIMHLMMAIQVLKEYDYVQISFAYLSKILETFGDYDLENVMVIALYVIFEVTKLTKDY